MGSVSRRFHVFCRGLLFRFRFVLMLIFSGGAAALAPSLAVTATPAPLAALPLVDPRGDFRGPPAPLDLRVDFLGPALSSLAPPPLADAALATGTATSTISPPSKFSPSGVLVGGKSSPSKTNRHCAALTPRFFAKRVMADRKWDRDGTERVTTSVDEPLTRNLTWIPDDTDTPPETPDEDAPPPPPTTTASR
eukprot:CAMPEP_0201632238 /NCGR_PEP_ID=MMETSP0493-20130528/5946_1 /ASSEMBLY_ACC=CAM_ASM_000838 /TAXON_ID=420259 /ORGANISM="Thalassiosira gravida, Strain GMp14c1" /LENGTH=192 /DNA_ID=CAMNT_0048103729 /DNA_START=465 /DNA_END=1043 /DNA_ORIENTATION=-